MKHGLGPLDYVDQSLTGTSRRAICLTYSPASAVRPLSHVRRAKPGYPSIMNSMATRQGGPIMPPTIEVLDSEEKRITLRYSDRKKATCKVTLSSGSRVGEGSVVDMTVPGCQLATAFPLEPGQAVQLRIHLDPKRPMRIDLGVVQWAKDGKAGIEFIRMAPEDQARLRLFVGHVNKRRRPNEGWGEAPMCVGF